MLTSFHVRVHNFQARDLNLTNNSGLSPFLKCNFDNFKIFKTDIVRKEVNPRWEFDLQFVYETRYPDKLNQKQFVVECFSYSVIGRDLPLGSIQVDLFTLATGPVSHDILLRDGGNPCGRILFDLEMEQVSDITATLKEVRVEADPGGNNAITIAQAHETFLCYFYTSKEHEERTFKSSKCPPSSTPSWNEMEQVFMKTTLRELHKEGLRIQHKQSKLLGSDPIIGETKVDFMKYLKVLHTEPHNYVITFSEVLRSFKDGGVIVGNINGTLVLQGVPIFAQMQGGVHTEVGIEGATPLFEGLQLPKGIIVEETCKHTQPNSTLALPPLTNEQRKAIAGSVIFPSSSDTPSQYNINSNNFNMNGNLNNNMNTNINSNNIAPSLSADTRSTPVIMPPGWEEMRDASGRAFYVDHNTQTTHWEPPQMPTSTPPPIIQNSSTQINPPSAPLATNVNLATRSDSVNNFSLSNNITTPIQTPVIQASAPPLPSAPSLPINSQPFTNPQPLPPPQPYNPYTSPIPSSLPQPPPQNVYANPVPNAYPSNVYGNPNPNAPLQPIQQPMQQPLQPQPNVIYPTQTTAVPAQVYPPYGYQYGAAPPPVYYPPQPVFTRSTTYYSSHGHSHGHHHHHHH